MTSTPTTPTTPTTSRTSTSKTSKTRQLVAGVALGAVLSGVAVTGAAVALPALAGAASTGQTDLTADAVADSDPGGRLDAVLAPLVADGSVTQAQADAVKGAVQDRVATRQSSRAERRDAMVEAAASFLGLSADEVTARWQAGDSLSDMAVDQGISRDDLVAAIESAIDARADAAVAAGTITADQATRIKDRAPTMAGKAADAHQGDHAGAGRQGRLGRLRDRLAG